MGFEAVFFFSSRRRHTRCLSDWSSDVCSSDLLVPSNVLMGTNGVIYLADFGLARIAQAEMSTLSSESTLGTPQYVSPEQAMGKSHLDERTDVYSFGVMLYEILVGQPPFHANTAFAIIHDHIYSPLPLPRTLNPNISELVEDVLL